MVSTGSEEELRMARVRELAELLGAQYEGDGEREIAAAAALETAGAREVSFVSSGKGRKLAERTAAGCLIVALDYDLAGSPALIRVKDPRRSFARVVGVLHPRSRAVEGIHPTAVIAPGVKLGAGVSIGAYSVIEEGATIGDRTSIGAHCCIGKGSRVGRDCALHAHVTLYEEVETGDRCLFHSGCVIGADGFGFVMEGGRYEKFPQIGKVAIGNDVEVGANTTIDRAALGVTQIGDGVKLDNLVHIGHNCKIGRHVVAAAQAGLSGGIVVEDHVVLGGQVGIGENATIQSGAILGGKSGVLTSKVLKGGGEVYWGIPAKPVKEHLEGLAHVARLGELRREVSALRAELEKLRAARAESK